MVEPIASRRLELRRAYLQALRHRAEEHRHRQAVSELLKQSADCRKTIADFTERAAKVSNEEKRVRRDLYRRINLGPDKLRRLFAFSRACFAVQSYNQERAADAELLRQDLEKDLRLKTAQLRSACRFAQESIKNLRRLRVRLKIVLDAVQRTEIEEQAAASAARCRAQTELSFT